MHSNITTTHLLQDTGCVAIPFVDVHPQTIAATLAVRSIPEGVTQAVVVILLSCIRSSSYYSKAFQKDRETDSCLKQGDRSASVVPLFPMNYGYTTLAPTVQRGRKSRLPDSSGMPGGCFLRCRHRRTQSVRQVRGDNVQCRSSQAWERIGIKVIRTEPTASAGCRGHPF